MKSWYYYFCFICIIYSILIKSCICYEIPLVQLELINNGFTLKFPDSTGIRNVLSVITINEKCPPVMKLLLEPINNMWSISQNNTALQDKDKLKISLLVNHNGDAYKSLQQIILGENNNNTAIRITNDNSNRKIDECGNLKEIQTIDCEASQTTVTNGQRTTTKICRNQLIFEENFNVATLDETKWSYDIRNLLTGQNTEEFVVFDNRKENVFISEGYLNIRPTVTNVKMREASINFGSRCTPVSSVRNECWMRAMPPNIYVPPVNSSQVNTRQSFRFKYGRVEVRAKLPRGDWLLPYITLQHYGPFDRKQIRIAFARGNEQLLLTDDSMDIGGRRLYGGIVKDDEMRLAIFKDTYNFEHYGNNFHIYTMTWTKDGLTFAVDGENYGEIMENLSEYEDEFFLTLGVSAGGHLEFPDDLPNPEEKPWQNTSPRAIQYFWQSFKNGKIIWNNTEAVTMQIDYVKIYAV